MTQESLGGLENCPNEAIDELVELTEVAEEKSKIALADLLRLLMKKDTQCQYILNKHWEMIDTCIFQYLSSIDLKDKDARST